MSCITKDHPSELTLEELITCRSLVREAKRKTGNNNYVQSTKKLQIIQNKLDAQCRRERRES